MGILLEGNANDDNAIEMFDFCVLGMGWLTSEGEPGYDGDADFDRDKSIGMDDFYLQIENWLRSSPIEIP